LSKKPRNKTDSQNPSASQVEAMLEAIIGLLGRLVFPEDKLKDMVTKGKKKDPERYVKAYNLLDGKHGVTEIAKEIGVAQPTLTNVISTWKGLGIVYEVEISGKVIYRRLYKVRSKRDEIDEQGQVEAATPQSSGGNPANTTLPSDGVQGDKQ
jgi:DNA-binding transcriptional ArsR family regulator